MSEPGQGSHATPTDRTGVLPQGNAGHFLYEIIILWYNLFCMIKENLALRSMKFIFRDIIFDILAWPVWWYTSGTLKAIKRMGAVISQGNEELGLSVWVKNIFKPMYGQYDWQGRLISFVMRLVQIIFRSIIFVLWIIVAFVGFIVWLVLPLAIIYEILLNLGLLENIL